MRLILIRHGETQEPWQPDTGHLDLSLSPLGRRQAQALTRELLRLRNDGIAVERVYSSPLAAAQATAKEASAALSLPSPEVNGALSTLTPEVLPAGSLEALHVMQERVWSAVEVLKEVHSPESNLVLSTHELPIRALVCRALGMALQDYRSFAVEPASLSQIEFRGPRTLLAVLNDVCHLERRP